jgi:CheY-like chemotaxis protein
MLGKLGYAADVAINGRDAIESAHRTSYDVILMDVQMPIMDGLEATRRLRADPPPGPRPWVVAVTANALLEDRERCVAAGMDDYLSKPVRRDHLAEVLSRVPASTR